MPLNQTRLASMPRRVLDAGKRFCCSSVALGTELRLHGWVGLDQRCICTDFAFDGLCFTGGKGVGV